MSDGDNVRSEGRSVLESDADYVVRLEAEVERLHGLFDRERGVAFGLRAEVDRLRAIMSEAAKQDPMTCRKWIRDARP